MKPQDSSPPRSSPTPEGASSNDPTENLATPLEHPNSAKGKNIPFDRKKLKAIIAGLEDDILTGRWFTADYASTDLQLMPALVEQANSKYPEMHLQLVTSSHHFALALKDTLENGIQSSRFIIYTKDRGIHFSVIDHQTIDDKTSVVFFEPTTLNNMKPAVLALRTQLAIKAHELSNCSFAIAEMDIQRSSSECGMFSLALAKKLYLESQKLERLHKDNVQGVLCEPDTPLSPEKLDSYLPVSLYKHAQGRRRLEHYLKTNPEAAHEKVNKKGETVTERFEKNLKEEGGKTVSVSQHRKRATEYKALTM
ncbi:YopJ/AvrA family T3SS effector serine/threonine acetyltransferase [Bartonella sp. B1098]|uniref:YopJ/AvrA family T3SS effector serine/threonine acetyltransferase n=1 Tax=Bartonella sp. B1098 TaxID=2911421 RepID=UPI0020C390B8|nr:YopJ/AvrA family T3SS effector serine/threonine acetyltransferase [Bartonella sp. B1098]